MKRRNFIKTAGAVTAGVMFKGSEISAMSSRKANIPAKEITSMVKLGKTDLNVSRIGFGGIVVMNAEPETAANAVKFAIEKGINYFDVAPSYGNAEEKLGPALAPYRKDVYLACKSHLRDAKGTKKLLDESLEKLQTDHFDVYQLHGITDVEKDVKASFAKGGAMETILEAKKNGIIRYVGFSAHTPEAALAAMDLYDFDTIMYPVNFCTHFNSRHEEAALAEAKKRGMGIIALKTMAWQKWQNDEDKKKYPKCWYMPLDDPEKARLALSWTLEQGANIAIPPGEEALFRLCVSNLPRAGKLSAQETKILSDLAAESEPIFTA
ncbi:General stress protein 69 [Limihaloglobus sulfuriphilus]|uniref:General stress protein 69 n=1 Tax=Limihaloglobus sulfuriphilus TaxID=1851148 RepID=A0A1Q2MBW1_9BACT|nr:aldo/keto reductase [Limihaloglobus sulfuriphilus]AQQ70171.1 General stress protein 69 [Limihaloglobus sulfuriphilus]